MKFSKEYQHQIGDTVEVGNVRLVVESSREGYYILYTPTEHDKRTELSNLDKPEYKPILSNSIKLSKSTGKLVRIYSEECTPYKKGDVVTVQDGLRCEVLGVMNNVLTVKRVDGDIKDSLVVLKSKGLELVTHTDNTGKVVYNKIPRARVYSI